VPQNQPSPLTAYHGFNISAEDIALLAAHGLKPIAGAELPPINTTTASKMYLPPGWGIGPDGSLINYNSAQPSDRGLQANETYAPYDVFQLNGNWVTFDPVAGVRRATAAEIKTAGGGTGSSGTDPAQIAYEYAKLSSDEKIAANNLAAQYMNMGLDAESARRQALTSLITNRNNTAISTAQTAADIAKTAATFAANPRDTYAEALYRNQVGGSTPFGDIQNSAFGTYGKALADKAASIFQPVGADMNQLRQYRDSIPPVDFFGPEQRTALGLPPTPAQAITGAAPQAPPTAPMLNPAPAPNDTAGALQFLQTMQNPQTANDFQRWVTTASGHPENAPAPLAMGGQIDLTGASAVQPPMTTTEGGLNMNMHEPARLVGMWTGRTYATVAEPRPDGTPRPEQIIVKPLPSELEKDRALKIQHKAATMNMGSRRMMDAGGTVTSNPTLDQMNEQYSKLLERLGGSGGGSSTPFGGARFLAGAPWNAIQADPFLQGVTDASYSFRGVDPAELAAQVKQFTPNAPQGNLPRVSFT
jgi:hypothetical protein